MTQVFFYHNARDRLAAAVTLISKAAAQKKALVIYAPDREITEAIDRQLWIQEPTSFVPHVGDRSPLAAETPVIITDSIESSLQNERLFNLSADIPPSFARFTSLIEVVGREEADRQAGRARVKFYKDRGYEVKFIDLAEKH